MSEENKALLRRMLDALNRRDLDVVDEVVADDVVIRGTEGEIRGRDALKADTAKYLGAFPDLTVALEDLIAEGDRVVARTTVRGTHTGELEGIPPTGRAVEVADVDIYRIQEGKVVEAWYQFDRFAMMQQLGLISEEEGNPT